MRNLQKTIECQNMGRSEKSIENGNGKQQQNEGGGGGTRGRLQEQRWNEEITALKIKINFQRIAAGFHRYCLPEALRCRLVHISYLFILI